jgi:hypothetical protein
MPDTDLTSFTTPQMIDHTPYLQLSHWRHGERLVYRHFLENTVYITLTIALHNNVFSLHILDLSSIVDLEW